MTDEQRIYVQQKLDGGMGREELRDLLLKHNYKEDLINELFAAYDARQSTPPPSPEAAITTNPSNNLVSYADLLREGFVLARKNLLSFLNVFVASFGFVGLSVLVLLLVGFLLETTSGSIQSITAPVALVVLFLWYVFLLLFSQVLGVSLVRALVKRSEQIGFWSSFWWSWSRVITIAAVAVYAQLLIGLGMMALIVPGIALAVYVSMSQFIIAAEERRGFDVLTRSFELVYGRWWAVLGRLMFPVLVLLTSLLVLILAVSVAMAASPLLGILLLVVIVVGVVFSIYWLVCCSVVLFESLQKVAVPTQFAIDDRNEITKWLRIATLVGLLVPLSSFIINFDDMVIEIEQGLKDEFPIGVVEAPSYEEFQADLDSGVNDVVEAPTLSDIEFIPSIVLGVNNAYSMSIPNDWSVEAASNVNGELEFSYRYVFDEDGHLVMIINSPVRETGYESAISFVVGSTSTAIGNLRTVNAVFDNEGQESGFKKYIWDGANDFWGQSFEITVPFQTEPYTLPAMDSQSNARPQTRYQTRMELEADLPTLKEIVDSIVVAPGHNE